MEERYQKELFEDFEKPRKPFPKMENIVPRTRFSLTLSLEKTVFVFMAIMMAMVLIYALGVESGKAAQRAIPAPSPASVQAPVQAPLQAPPQAPAAGQVQAAPQGKAYTVVVATFTRKDWADREIERLKKSGREAAVYQSANYFLVCVGSYPAKDAAKEALSKLRSTYKDAYLRSR